MADKQTDVQIAPVSLPPRSFDVDELQKALDTTASKLKDGDDPDLAMTKAVYGLVGDDQPDVNLNTAAMPDYLVVDAVNAVTGEVQRTQVYVPEDLKPAQTKVLDAVSSDTGKVLDTSGKAIDTPADPIPLDPAAEAATTASES